MLTIILILDGLLGNIISTEDREIVHLCLLIHSVHQC